MRRAVAVLEAGQPMRQAVAVLEVVLATRRVVAAQVFARPTRRVAAVLEVVQPMRRAVVGPSSRPAPPLQVDSMALPSLVVPDAATLALPQPYLLLLPSFSRLRGKELLPG